MTDSAKGRRRSLAASVRAFDVDGVDSPPGCADLIVASQPPAQDHRFARRGSGQINDRGHESTGVPRPRGTSFNRTLVRGDVRDCAGVASRGEASASGEDVREGAAVDADLENATIKAVLKIEVVTEGELRVRR